MNIRTSLKSFPLKFVQNSYLDKIRHRKIVNNYQSHFSEHTALYEIDTENYILYSDLYNRLQKALEKMPEEYRTAFEMNRFDRLNYHEIALQLNVSERTVEVLPALPTDKEWKKGTVKGFRTRGAFVVDFSWENSLLKKGVIFSEKGLPDKLFLKEHTIFTDEKGKLYNNTNNKLQTMRIRKYISAAIVIMICSFYTINISGQITERERPKEWGQLVPGARFMDRFLPMPKGILSSDTWGAKNVIPRYTDNGIEDRINSYWGGNIVLGDDQKYHLFVCGWKESSPKGHGEWPNSIVYHTICDNSTGPFLIKDTIGPGHNPEIFRAKNGSYVIYVINGYYLSDHLNGPWTYHKFEFDKRDRPIIEGLSNLTFSKREDGSFLMVCRGGGIWISETGLSAYKQISDRRVYPAVAGEFEDPVVWRDHIQYHLIVNDWLGRIAFYQRSKDGVHWVTDPGEAYTTGFSIHEDGRVENWFKYERIKILQDKYGRAIQANFAVIDTLKAEDKPNDNHSSKNISIPLNPGLLLTMLNSKPIDKKTKKIQLKITAEKGFNPHTDIDINSLRFGSSSEVNFGRGCIVSGVKKSGPDLIVTFNALGNGITEEEFAPKLIGKSVSGKLLYGYTRLPWINYNESILSARMPVFSAGSGTIEVQNFGQVSSKQAILKIYLQKAGTQIEIGSEEISPLNAYEKTNVAVDLDDTYEKGEECHFMITIQETNKPVSIFEFSAVR